MLSSWRDKERRGNLVGELIHMTNKMKIHPEEFSSFSSIEETLELFLYCWYLLGETTFILEDEALLVEAALGRIKILGGNARVVMDEPIVLRAVQNYFKQKDPMFIASAERIMLSSTNPSVHGSQWEAMMPPVFFETFKSMPFSKWPLLPNNCTLPDQLNGDVSIVGYNENEQLATSYRTVSLLEFMEAHSKHNSMFGDIAMPPFYFPSEHISGPDIIFYINIEDQGLVPVFVQLKLRQTLYKSDAELALETTSGATVANKICIEEQLPLEIEKENKEDERMIDNLKSYKIRASDRIKNKIKFSKSTHDKPNLTKASPSVLQDLCPSGLYISMVVAYPAEVLKFQDVCPDPDSELPHSPGLKRVIINIDNRNFGKIFPARHVNFLDNLKKSKRKPESDLQQ
ncbi:hypothetical protein BGZ76_005402, partial [Entomortierella beljakovae]